MEGCIFCNIASGETDTDVVVDREDMVAFRDINPQAPVHILIVPKEHITSIKEIEGEQCALLLDMFLLANEIAVDEGVAQSGYRLVINTGEDAGQEISHLHIHLLGGRFMKWPPG